MGNISQVRLDALSALDASALPTEFRLFQFGDNPTSKGTFKLDADGAAEVMAAYKTHGAEVAIDYEHQTFEAAGNGQPAPAAGWFVPQARPDGLWATNVRWTPRAAEMLRNREYRYFSPTFHVDKKNRITKLLPAALTNLPASHGQEPLIAASERRLTAWSTAVMDDLPDSSFLYVEAGGQKEDGKTTPRSLRHFPVKDAGDKVDLPHVRNALARIPDSNVPADVKARITAEAKRMLGHQQTTERLTMNISTLIGLKDGATEDEVSERVISLGRIERRLLEVTGKDSVADAMSVLIAAKDASVELEAARKSLREWEERHTREEMDSKRKTIATIVEGAVIDGRVSLKNVERQEQLRRHGEEYGIEALRTAVSLMEPRPVRQYQAPPPANTIKAQMAAIEKYKKDNPTATAADAYVALSQSQPAMFADTTGSAVEE